MGGTLTWGSAIGCLLAVSPQSNVSATCQSCWCFFEPGSCSPRAAMHSCWSPSVMAIVCNGRHCMLTALVLWRCFSS